MDPKELITGREKRELLVEESGKDPVCGILARNIALCMYFHEEYVNWFYLFMQDPYGLTIKRGAGTKDKPNLVPSAFESRIVGCVCEDESSHINWMWLHKGTPTRCGCGFWFKLVEKAPV